MICVGFGLVGGSRLISISVILVGNSVVSGCSDVGLVFDRLLRCFFFFLGVDGRLWVVGGGGGDVKCVQCSDGGDCGC